jgi:hypothetical protein
VCVDGQLRLWINHILAQSIPCLHQRIQIVPTGMHLHPSRVVFRRRRLRIAHRRQRAVVSFLVTPNSVRPHVCRVEVGLGKIEDHAVDGGLRAVFVVLNIGFQGAIGVSVEDVAEASVLVKGVAIDAVGWFAGGQDEDSACAGICFLSFG